CYGDYSNNCAIFASAFRNYGKPGNTACTGIERNNAYYRTAVRIARAVNCAARRFVSSCDSDHNQHAIKCGTSNYAGDHISIKYSNKVDSIAISCDYEYTFGSSFCYVK